MIVPGKLDLRANRWQPFVYVIDFEGFDFTGATMEMQIRLYPDAPGAALVSLVNAISSAQGLSVSVATVDAVTTSSVQIRINETTLEALMPFPDSGVRPGKPLDLAHDLVITGGGLPKTRWLEGPFSIYPGVTQ